MNFILATILLLLLNAVEYSSCERFNIVPSPDSPCPGEFTGEPCLTLQQYVANPSLSSNITFVLHPGNHSLDSQISMQNINSFEMRANTSATVTCNQQLHEPFYFYRLHQVYVSGITFVGCRMAMWYITNATIERNSSFVDGSYRYFCCYNGRALYSYRSSVLIRQCNISNNRVYRGAIYGSQSTFIIEQTTFSMNRNYYTCCTVQNGAAINFENGNLDIHNSTFDSNSLSANSHGGAIYTSSAVVNITGTHFSDNRAGRNGGAVYFDGSNISITNSSFINNTAIAGGGGAIYSARRYTNISLVDNIFNRNIAAYCGVMEVAEFYHYHVNIIGNTFVYNRAIQQISGNYAAGVICIRNASILVIGNTFSHNSAAGDAGVIQVDESDVIIERSIFNNNTAGGNGGVLHTYFYPTVYTIIDSSFTNNRAGRDGGVMYVGRAGSHVTISQSTFSFNNATERGGVIAIIGSNLEINGGRVFENDAAMGEIISACNSIVTIFNVGFHTVQDPTYSFCSLYDHGTTSITPSIEDITTTDSITTIAPAEDTTTAPTISPSQEAIISSSDVINIVPSPDSPCPGEFTGEPCLTLQQYVANPSLSSNITFELHPGNHILDSQLQVLNINSFAMRANTSATITCRQQLYRIFYFYQLQQVNISGITFVGCRMELWSITNATIERNSFVNRIRCCSSGAALYSWYSSVLIRQCNVSNNRVYNGAIYGSRSTFVIEQSTFRNNRYPYNYGCCSTTYGGAIYLSDGNLNILNSYFRDNSVATYRGDGGAIYFDGNNITITNSYFISNTANSGGGGAIYSARRYTNISLVNNIFNRNTAAYCGVMEVAEFYHDNVNITGNTFTYNRAIRQISGNNGGGVICIRNASVLLLENTFSHNSAAGDAGVIQADESDVIIERSIFSNNRAGGNGGVLHTYFYPTTYTITDCIFINNRVGGDGGVMYIGRALSHVTINQGTFGFNYATNRGGVISIIGSTLEMNGSSIFGNSAELGDVISACNSNTTIFNLGLLLSQDPTYSFCSLYNESVTTNITSANYTNAEIDDVTTSSPASQVYIINIVPTPDSPCPGEFTGEPCFTLEQYAAYPSHTPNIMLNLHPGIHHLNSQFYVSNIHSFTMHGNIATTVTIICREETYYRSFDFNRLQLISVSGITFIGCSMNLGSVVNATVVKSSFLNRTRNGVALSTSGSSVWIKQCTMSNNNIGAVSFSGSNSFSLTIDQSLFSNNSNSFNTGYYYYGGGAIDIYSGYYNGMAVYPMAVNIVNSIFKDNYGINFHSSNDRSNVNIANCTFRNNTGISFSYPYIPHSVNILNSTFKDNRAYHSDHGGAIHFNGDNISILNSKFVNNTANGRGGGAINFASSRYSGSAIVLLVNNTFSHNTAAYCGVIKMTESYHFNINITGNTFTFNRAMDLIPGNNGGGVICARNASVSVVDNNFSHNSATGDAGVIQADNSQITIERSIFSNNTAGGNGGALQTYLYPTNYMIVNSSFTNNQAGGDGGAMYIGRAGCHVTIYGSTFSDNYAAERGGVIAIIGSTLQLNQASIYENFARTGEVVNSCNSNVTIINSVVLATQDPIVSSLCAPYNDSVSPTTVTTTPVPQLNDTTEDVTVMTTAAPQPEDTTTDSITVAKTTTHQPDRDDVTSKPATEDARSTHTTESDSAEEMTTSQVNIDDRDSRQDTAQNSLHTTVPGYVAMGVVVVLLVLVALFGVVILVKVFKVKQPPLRPPKVNHPNFSAYEYPTMKNEFALPEVHLVST